MPTNDFRLAGDALIRLFRILDSQFRFGYQQTRYIDLFFIPFV